nr:PREDICTED: homeobox protein CDX-1 isoform X2 [Equus przewalskii]
MDWMWGAGQVHIGFYLSGWRMGAISEMRKTRRHTFNKDSSRTLCVSGKTRTKDKYRVVYTDHQRLELEKEFHYSRYITIRRKSELAANLGLTERQVKIWFQNRRAKERKVNKKKQQQEQQPPPPPPPAPEVTPAPAGPPLGTLCPSSAGLLGASSPMPVKEEYLP